MQKARALLQSVLSSLQTGAAPLVHLGSGPPGSLDLDAPGGLQRYAEILGRSIQQTLKGNRRQRHLLIALLVALFIVAIALTVYEHLRGAGWTAKALVVPGLGVAAAWPLQALMALNRQAVALEVFPDMLPLLSRRQAAKLDEKFLSGGLT